MIVGKPKPKNEMAKTFFSMMAIVFGLLMLICLSDMLWR